MRFLVDECLPPSLAAQLCAAGHDAVSVVGLGLAGAADPVVMQAARDQERVLMSADTDFGELLARSDDRRPSVVLYRGAEVDPKALALILLANLPRSRSRSTPARSWFCSTTASEFGTSRRASKSIAVIGEGVCPGPRSADRGAN